MLIVLPCRLYSEDKDADNSELIYQKYDVYEVDIDSGYLNIRTKPSKETKVIGQLSQGRCVLAKRGTFAQKEGFEWVELAYLKGWTAKEYLKDSKVCEDAFSIVDGYYQSALEECLAVFNAPENAHTPFTCGSQDMKNWIADYVDLSKSLNIYCVLNCDSLEGGCKIKNQNEGEHNYTLSCTEPVETIFNVLKWMNIGCDRYCTQGIDTCGECNGEKRDVLFKCDNVYLAFLDGLEITSDAETNGFNVFAASGVECCSNMTITFEKKDDTYKISKVSMFLD